MVNSWKGNTKIVTIEDNFYLALPINATWHNFFAGLEMKDEKSCDEVFIKKYLKEKEIRDFIAKIHDRVTYT